MASCYLTNVSDEDEREKPYFDRKSRKPPEADDHRDKDIKKLDNMKDSGGIDPECKEKVACPIGQRFLKNKKKGWTCKPIFYQCLILFVMCYPLYGQPNKMFMSVGERYASFNEHLSILCHINSATVCNQPAWLYGTSSNGELRWKLLARREIPFTQQYLPLIYNDTDVVTYIITILHLQSGDLSAWFRCECNENNNVSQRLIQIDDGFIVRPEVFDSSFKISNRTINATTVIKNVYPEPENCSFTILNYTHSHVVSYNCKYSTNVTKPDLMNVTYSGLSHIPFRVCKPNVTVTCYLGDLIISKDYSLVVCDEPEKMYEEMKSWSMIVVSIILCACLLIICFAVTARCFRSKIRKDKYAKEQMHVHFLPEYTIHQTDVY